MFRHILIKIDKLELPYVEQGKKLMEKAEKIAELDLGISELIKKKGEVPSIENVKAELLLPATESNFKPRPPTIPPPDIIAKSKQSEKETLKEILHKSDRTLYPSMDSNYTGGKKIN